MAWSIEYTDSVLKQLKKMDRQIARSVLDYMDARVSIADDPRALAKKLLGPQYGAYWRYRIGDIRIICRIEDDRLTILVVELGHRREVYR